MRISDYIKSMRAPVLILVLLICISCLRAEALSSNCFSSDTEWEGLYRVNCTEKCSPKCYKRRCNKTTGKCLSCEAGYRSFNCTLECPPNCLNDSNGQAICDQDTAHCTNCQPTWWGLNCTNKCDSNCKHGVCDFERGHCHECKVGKMGDKCSEDCPMGCWIHECHRDNMTCASGCRRDNNTCTSECHRDNMTCTGGCHRDNMTCTGGCYPGYFGERCDKKCNDNCKGVECSAIGATGTSSMCAVCRDTCFCHQNTGQCQSCKTGFWGDTCDEPCPKQCPDCSNATCSSSSDRSTGSDDQMTPISQIVVPIVLSIVIVLVALVIYKIRSKIFRLCRPSRPLSDEADTCLRA
ncbi:scavenger receptor class F member 1-like [Haliotis cracherodii]|uniref:scavenger receptor class F member 1-like n=1 Tax=Haliotis cracherodii TaxID=6455 RepID=UPI0039EBB461